MKDGVSNDLIVGMKHDRHMKQVELGTVVGREAGKAVACNVIKVTLTPRVIYTRWRQFKGKCSVLCRLQNLNL
jgi:hypothetical protein